MINLKNYRILGVSLLALSLLVPVYVNSVNAQVTINGAGATFPFPLIDTWRVEYKNVNPDVNINYASIGSGGGIKQFIEKTVDFGATDAPLSASEFEKAGSAVHIPETIGSVVLAYNLPEVTTPLNLTGPVIADIFMGKITKWDDAKIKELNPGVTLPSEDIISVHRSDGSGTSFVFTDYLSKVSPEWHDSIGVGKSVQWPSGIGAPGNEGVAASIQGSPYSIGYVELAYAITTQMTYASIQNKEGNFIAPSFNSTMDAVSSAAGTLPEGSQSWTNVTLTYSSGPNSYPISSLTYLLLYKDLSTNPSIDEQKAKSLVDFVEWAITDGQQFSESLGYVPLPQSVVDINEQTLKSLTFKGTPILSNSTS
ncbi:MAG: phosphate ABC transporter substrate-binding protein PstS [Candidatus Nitrosocosmicus sp.]|jgi:phosphate ABC transporter phosphate-binding protein|nr:phosphate ABC transporter substrate-binding protein PstS [Candidatus Nitrosocosmicus sp.]